MRPVQAGLHAFADLDDVDEELVCDEAKARGVEVSPMGTYFIGRRMANGLVLGFAATRPDAIREGIELLAASIEAARRTARHQRLAR